MRLIQERRRWFGASTDNDAIKSARALSVEMAAQSRETQRVFHGLRGENIGWFAASPNSALNQRPGLACRARS